MHHRLPWLVLLGACSSSTGSGGGTADPLDFTLRLRPLTPLNQADLFDDVDSYTVTVDRGAGDVEVYELGGTASDGTVTTPEVAQLDGAAVGIYGYDAGGELIAYGRSADWTLPSDDDPDVAVLVGRVGAVGRLTDLPSDGGADGEVVAGTLTSDSRGGFMLLGGDERGTDGTDDATDDVLRLNIGRPNTRLSFVRSTRIPDGTSVNDGLVEGLAGHTATVLTGNHDDQGLVLVAGGAQGMTGSSTVTDRVLLWDMDNGDFVALGDEGRLPEGVYHHTADEFGAGFVALLGGAVGRSNSQPVEDRSFSFAQSAAVYEPRSKRMHTVPTGPSNGPMFLHDAAAVDGEFVLMCGGLVAYDNGARWEASMQCDIVTDTYEMHEVEDPAHDLPLPLLHHDMTALPDGRVLLTGGFTTDGQVGDGGTVSASDDIWAYSSDKGWEYIGALNVARGEHTVSVLADGTVLVVGGSTSIDGPLWDADAPTGCLELIDPSTLGNATLVGDCDGSAFSADELSTPVILPMVASDPDYGTLIVGGADDGNDAVGQVAWYLGGIVEP